MSLNADLICEILKRVDGATLASVECASSLFRFATREEHAWEELCSSMWPSTRNEEVRSLIFALGGFRKFYRDCFPMVLDAERVSTIHCNLGFGKSENSRSEYCDKELHGVSPSDFVSLVDLYYRDKAIYSKILWGIPGAADCNGWFSNSPFSIDLLTSFDKGENGEGQVNISLQDGLPQITSLERERKDGKLWSDLWDNIRLSWILVNTKEKQAVNISSWSPLGGQKHWPTEKDFLLLFGSILPAHKILPLGVVQGILAMKCRIPDDDVGEGSDMTLKLTELGMRLEDMEGAHVNGRNSLLILKRALSCHRTMNYNNVLASYQQFLKTQSELKDEKMKNENLIDTLCALGGITAFAIICFLIL